MEDLNRVRRQTVELRSKLIQQKFQEQINKVPLIRDINVMVIRLDDVEIETMRNLCDQFRQKYPSGIIIIGSVINDRPLVIAAVTEDVNARGINAGDLVKVAAKKLGGSGGGKPTIAQAGGKDPARLDEALNNISRYIEENLR